MRRDPAIKIRVVDTDMIADASKHFQILVRLLYFLFAKDPDSFAVVNSKLYKVATKYGFMGEDLPNERLLSPEICAAIKNNEFVKLLDSLYIYNDYINDIIFLG